MGKDWADAADAYIDPMPLNEMPSRLALMSRAASKDLEAEQMDYDSLMDGNPSPSLRDQEYLQHSSLWGGGSRPYASANVATAAAAGPVAPPRHMSQQQLKNNDATLPAYCNPPNPCPVGFTEEQGCQVNFENTASYSRDYQAAQECMCDGEHMFDCPGQEQQDTGRQINSDLESYLARQFNAAGAPQEHKNFMAKKFQPSKVKRFGFFR